MDANEFIRNVGSHSPDEMVPFEEQYVAWSEDGKHVLAHAPTREDLYREIDAKGLTRYVVGFVPNPDISFLGGGALFDLHAPELPDQDTGPVARRGGGSPQASDPH